MNKDQLIHELISKMSEQARNVMYLSRGTPAFPGRNKLYQALSSVSRRIRQEIDVIQATDFTPSKNVRVGSVVTVSTEKRRIERYFILPAGAGRVLRQDTPHPFTIITPNSPVGRALIGKESGDSCEVKASKKKYHLTVLYVE